MKDNKTFDSKRIFYLIMTLLVAATIFYASSIQTTGGVPAGLNLAMLYHFGIFFIFTFFLTLTLLNQRLNTKTILLALSISLIYALSDEFHQLFVVGRLFAIKDILTDFAGSVCAVVFLKLLDKFRKI